MRAWLKESKEFMYAENTLVGLSTFYGVLEGMRLTGQSFVIDRPTGIRDVENTEVYENDILHVVYKLTAKEVKEGYLKTVKAPVVYHDGCFVAKDDSQDYMDFLSNEVGELYSFKIIGHGHK